MAVTSKDKPLPKDIPPVTYGVWIKGVGWLKDTNSNFFADPRVEYAQAALRMWAIGDDTPCRIELIDESMIGLQPIFLGREEKHFTGIQLKREMRRYMFNKSFIGRIVNGILERFSPKK